MSVTCFLIEAAGFCHRYLRRHASGACPLMPSQNGYHDAGVFLDRIPTPRTENGYVDGTLTWPADDPRWPKACGCGYVFAESDGRDLFVHDLYWRKADKSGEWTLHGSPYPGTERVPPGAMWDAWWMGDWKGPDGLHLAVMLPDGCEWLIDGPSSNGGSGWQRSGEPPNVTARPSILTPKYHGFLTNGVLESC